MWTASTIKLAMAADLLERARVGALTLDATARQQIADMLDFSSNSAADRLWRHFELADRVHHYRDVYGMGGLEFPAGYRYWGAMKCTTDGLLEPDVLRARQSGAAGPDYIVDAMRTVDQVQQWGVWAAGRPRCPRREGRLVNREGPGGEHWVANSVGFAGPDARYVVAVMYQLPPGVKRDGSIDAGVHAISDIVATIFGRRCPPLSRVPGPMISSPGRGRRGVSPARQSGENGRDGRCRPAGSRPCAASWSAGCRSGAGRRARRRG